MAKIERKYMAHYVDAALPAALEEGEPNYVRIGKDLEEYAPEKSGSVEPYYAEKGDPLFARLQAIVDGGLVLDDCNTTVVEVHLWEEKQTNGFPAVKDDAVIEVSSYGGDSAGYQIPFTLHYKGAPVAGFFDPDTNAFSTEAGV